MSMRHVASGKVESPYYCFGLCNVSHIDKTSFDGQLAAPIYNHIKKIDHFNGHFTGHFTGKLKFFNLLISLI